MVRGNCRSSPVELYKSKAFNSVIEFSTIIDISMRKNGGKYSVAVRSRATSHKCRRRILQEEYKRIESLLKLRKSFTVFPWITWTCILILCAS